MPNSFQYLFGPVPSRRLGRSLGVDLIPFKRCTMNCIFCQLGPTASAVSDQTEEVPLEQVLEELDRWKQSGEHADHITLAGSGEPTLHPRFGEVLSWVRGETDIPSVLLTNGSLLYLPDVRTAAAMADKVKVTMSVWDETSFQRLHRPAAGITFARLLEGERAFRQAFSGELSVEVFLVNGINSKPEQVRKIAQLVEEIAPDRIDINTAVRPPAESTVCALKRDELERLAELFDGRAEVIAAADDLPSSRKAADAETIEQLIQRHPATAEQLLRQFDMEAEKLNELLEGLMADQRIDQEMRSGAIYYIGRKPNQTA